MPVYLEIESLLDNPRVLAKVVRMLNRRNFMGGCFTSLTGAWVYLTADKLENKTIRTLGKVAGGGAVLLGGAQAITPLCQSTLKDWDGFVETFRQSLDKDRSLDR